MAVSTGQAQNPDAASLRPRAADASFTLRRHLSKTAAIAVPLLVAGVILARDVSAAAWLWVPVFWIIANGFEWTVHRYPMHRPLRPRALYQRHTLTHHRAFPATDLEIRSVTELSIVMMPWWTLLVFFTMATPIAVAIGLLGGWGLVGVFLVSAVLYFCVYETLHTLYHLPQSWLAARRWGRSRGLAFLAAHHHFHHRMEHMSHCNFNVTFPLTDVLLRTYRSEHSRA